MLRQLNIVKIQYLAAFKCENIKDDFWLVVVINLSFHANKSVFSVVL